MHWLKSHFRFTKQQRSGIFFLLLLIVLIQGMYLLVLSTTPDKSAPYFRIDAITQKQVDSLKKLANQQDYQLRPFNPNFISDFKGYTLGMSTLEIDRLHAFRAQNQYVNTAQEFQEVTRISDTLLTQLAPLFRFPEWVNEKTAVSKDAIASSRDKNNFINAEVKDLNNATAADLKAINGIGEVLSKRIVKFRNRLGGFLVNEQLYDVYGLEPIVANCVLKEFQVLSPPEVKKININTASVAEIASLIYLNNEVAQNIVIYRETHGEFKSFNKLFNVSGFPINKIDRITLYLSY